MNISNFDREVLMQEWKNVLLELYNGSMQSIMSNDLITRMMLLRIRNLELLKDFKLCFTRGYFVNDDHECDTGEVYDIEHYDLLCESYDTTPCEDCGCYFMNPHSYIELLDNKTGELGVLDFTRYQYETDKFAEWLNSEFESDEDCVNKLMGIADFDVKDIEKYR